MYVVVWVKNIKSLHLIEHVVKHASAALKDISPQSFDALVVNTFTCSNIQTLRCTAFLQFLFKK